jgi:hypothetical protein
VESAGRVGSRLGKVSELTIIVPFAPGGAQHPYPGMTISTARPRPPGGPARDGPARCAARGASRYRA